MAGEKPSPLNEPALYSAPHRILNPFVFAGLITALAFSVPLTGGRAVAGQPPEPTRSAASVFLTNNLDRPWRYTPDGTDFVITNGAEFFNRPLYGGSRPFRVEAGDEPEFSRYLPGRGGNLRLGFRAGGKSIWLPAAKEVVRGRWPATAFSRPPNPPAANRDNARSA